MYIFQFCKRLMNQGLSVTCILEAITILTHNILVDSATVICWPSVFVFLRVSGLFCHFYSIFGGKPC